MCRVQCLPIVICMRADRPSAEEAEGVVADEDKKRAAHRALVDRILSGEGKAPADQRVRAFRNDGLAAPLDALIAKVAENATQVTEQDLAAAKASGCTEDHLFELVVCAAVGEATRQYEAGLAALAEATGQGEV